MVTAGPKAEAAEEEQPEPEPTPRRSHATAAVAVEDYLNAWARGNYRAMRDVATGNAYLYANYLHLADRPGPMLFGFSPPTISTGRAPGDVVEASETRVVFDGQATMTTNEDPTAVEFTEFVAELTDDGWRVADMVCDGRPLADFVADPTASEAVAVNAVPWSPPSTTHRRTSSSPWWRSPPTATVRSTSSHGTPCGEQGATLRVQVSDTQELNRFAFELTVPPFSDTSDDPQRQ